VRVLDASARVIFEEDRPCDGVCVTIAPSGCRDLGEFLDRAQFWADRIEADLNLADSLAPPVRVRGPAISMTGTVPGLDQLASLYREQIVTGPAHSGQGARRLCVVDGVDVPIYAWADLRVDL
jgi:hypothetical protein